jgi:hypothetical protein
MHAWPRPTPSPPTDRRRLWSRAAHGFTTLPLASSTTSAYMLLHVKANPFSSSSRSPPLALLFNGHQSCHRVPRCLAVRFAGPHRVAKRHPDPEPPPGEQSPKSFEAEAACHLFHGHLIDDLLIQPPSRPASSSMSFQSLPRSSLNPSRLPQPPNDPLTNIPLWPKCATTDSPTPVSTPPSDPQNQTPLDVGLLLVSFPASQVTGHQRIDERHRHRAMERLTPLFPFVAESEA